MSARKRRTRSRSGTAANNFAHGGKKRRTKLNLVHSPCGGGGPGSVVQAHEKLRDKAVRRVQFPSPPSPEEKHTPAPALDVPAVGPADFSLSQDKDPNEGTFIRMTPNYSPPVPGGLVRQTSGGVAMTPPVASRSTNFVVTSSGEQSSSVVSASASSSSSSSSRSSSSMGARSKIFLQPQPPTDSDPKFDLKFTPPSVSPARSGEPTRANELFPLSVDSLPDSSADSCGAGIAGLHLSADSVTSTNSGGGLGLEQSSSSSSSSQNDEIHTFSLKSSASPLLPPSNGAVGVLVPTESLSRILVDNALSVGDNRSATSASSRSRDKFLPLNREEQFDMDGDAAQLLLSLSQNSDKGGGNNSSSVGSNSVVTPSLPPNPLTASSNSSNSSPTLTLMTNGLQATFAATSASSSSSLSSGSVPMPLVGGGLGKGKSRILFNAPVLPPLPPALPNSASSNRSSSGGNVDAASNGPISTTSKYLSLNFADPQHHPKFLPPLALSNSSSSSSDSPSRNSSSRSRSRSSRSSQSSLHMAADITNGVVVPMSDDPDIVVVANPEEQSTSSSSSGAEVHAALASIGAVQSASSGLDLQTSVFVRDERIDTNNADPVPTATALIVKCFLDARKGTGRDIFGTSRSDVPVCMRIIAQRGTKKFFRGSRVEFIFQGHEYDEVNEENWFNRIFSVEYAYNVAVSDPFCVTLSPSGNLQDANALPSALVLTMRITPHLSTAVVSTARRKKQKRRKKTADLERMTLTFQMARGHGDFATSNLLAESTVELYISPRSTWEKQRTKKHRR